MELLEHQQVPPAQQLLHGVNPNTDYEYLFAVEFSRHSAAKSKSYCFNTNRPMTAESYAGFMAYLVQDQDRFLSYFRRVESAEMLNNGWVCGTLLTSGDFTKSSICWDCIDVLPEGSYLIPKAFREVARR